MKDLNNNRVQEVLVFNLIAEENMTPKSLRDIIAEGFNVNAEYNKYPSLLFLTVNMEKLGLTEVLLEAGAKVSLKNEDGETVVDIIRSGGTVDMLELLEAGLEKEVAAADSKKRQKIFDRLPGRTAPKPRRRPKPIR